MEKFNSQICTTREQSERLLALGLKKETADMCHRTNGMGIYFITAIDPLCNPNDIPAWSLHRLIEMLNKSKIFICGFVPIDANRCYEDVMVHIANAIKSNRFKKDYLEEKQ